MRTALAPLLLAWLAVHAALLAVILVIRFLGAKTVLLALLVTGIFWFLHRGKPVRPALPGRVIA
jgi:hypothetical protein